MQTENLLKSLSLKEKLFQMFILGFSGENLDDNNINIQNSIRNGLGGVILFEENITSYEQSAKLSENLQNIASTPLFISIDQEGGRVERTTNIKDKANYLSPGELETTEETRIQADLISKELGFMGVNMNFAPVMDVNTNKNNPIIGIRSFGNDTGRVSEFAREVYKSFMANSIIPVAKHFPGHGDTSEDSHQTMPVVNLDIEELDTRHISPFKQAIKDGVDLIMVNHAHYTAFDTEPIPASLSKNVIKHYLRDRLGYQGIVVSDDMVMGGIKNYYKACEACIKGIEAGIDLFVFRNFSDEPPNIVEKIYEEIQAGRICEDRINRSVERILLCKKKYNLWNKKKNLHNYTGTS